MFTLTVFILYNESPLYYREEPGKWAHYYWYTSHVYYSMWLNACQRVSCKEQRGLHVGIEVTLFTACEVDT